MFETDFDHLNEKQKEAVCKIKSNLLVLAPAGTGKTKVMAMRAAYLIRNNVLPQEILCLTFTNKAAKEMKERILSYLPEEATDITIKTFHAFCYTLISSEKQASHFSFPCTIIDETDSDAIIKKIIHKQNINDEHLYYPQLRAFIENIKRYSLSFQGKERYEYKKIIASYLKEEVSYKKPIRNFSLEEHGTKLFEAYQKDLKENNCIDFMDLIVEAQYLLEEEAIRIRWHNKYHYIQVDEMQDTSTREYDMIKKIAGTHNLSLFGDFNQTIYEWRGSSPKSMLKDFKKDFVPEVITLTVNYRGTKLLLEAANEYIKNSRLYPIECVVPDDVSGEKIQVIQASTQEDELHFIAQDIQAKRAKVESIAVLTRTNEYAKRISELFQKYQIPSSVIEDTKFFRRKEIKDILAFFEYSINLRNGHALHKICGHPYLNMPDWLLKQLSATQEAYMYLYDWFTPVSQDPYTKLFTAYRNHQIVVLDVETTGLDTTRDEIIQIAALKYGQRGGIETLDLLVKPTQTVGTSYLVHGLSDECLKEKGISPQNALEQLLHFIKETVIVGHNIKYDLHILSSMLSRYKMEDMEPVAVYDTLDLAYKVYPHMSNHKLDTLASYLNTDTKPNHNALQDILATSEILTHLIKTIALKGPERLERLEAFYSYTAEYKEKLNSLTYYILKHDIPDSISYMMNTCGFKNHYTSKELEGLRELYRMSKMLYDSSYSVQDNIIHFLNYGTMHYSEIEESELFKNRIPIITIHQSKGLEFDEVYIAGCNDKVFPSAQSIRDHALEEEHRLFYVGMTRARKRLFLSYHQQKPKSIFLDEIGSKYIQYKTYSQNL